MSSSEQREDEGARPRDGEGSADAEDGAGGTPRYINKLDDFQTAVNWMARGRVDARGLAKYLPHTAQDLKAKRVTPEQVAGTLEIVYNANGIIRLKGMDRNKDLDPMMTLAHLTTMKLLPPSFFRTRHARDDIAVEFSADLQQNYFEKCSSGRSRGENIKFLMNVLLQQSIDQVCEQWAPRLDKELFRGRRGTFLRRCPLYGKPASSLLEEGGPLRMFLDEIDTDAQKEESERAEMRKSTLLVVTKQLAAGEHKMHLKCWECRRVFERVMQCSICQAATYCSQGCQKAAWKSGHKLKCEALRSRYAHFQTSLKALDEAHSAGGVMHGISLSEEVDYRVLSVTFTRPPLPIENYESLGEPSMSVFHENLGRAARGEFWFWAETDDRKYRALNLCHEAETSYFFCMCAFMCYDFVGAARRAIGCEPDPAKIAESCTFTDLIESSEGAAMPAATFVAIYKRGWDVGKAKISVDRFRLRRQIRQDCIDQFREEFHK